MKAAWTVMTAIGEMTLAEEDGKLVSSNFGAEIPDGYEEVETPFITEASTQIHQFLRSEREAFTIPLAPEGTAFQRLCWQALCDIPYGEMRSYGEQAIAIGNPKACRAVGMANNRNPLPIFIPCHRVIGKNGTLVGYGGGLDIKKILLESEQARKDEI